MKFDTCSVFTLKLTLTFAVFFLECFPEEDSLWTWPPRAMVWVAFLPFLTPGLAWADSLLQGQGTSNARHSLSPAGQKVSVCFPSLHPWLSEELPTRNTRTI